MLKQYKQIFNHFIYQIRKYVTFYKYSLYALVILIIKNQYNTNKYISYNKTYQIPLSKQAYKKLPMFTNSPKLWHTNEPNEISNKSLNILMSHSRQSRQQKRSRMRQVSQIQLIPYQKVSFNKFIPILQQQTNPYTYLITIFSIADNFEWRKYVCHLQILIKKFTNFVQSSRGKILQEISKNCNNSKQILCGYDFQQRLQTMLHLSNKQFQGHLLILIHALIAYNKRYCILEESKLSDHLIYRHAYEKCIRSDVLWLLTRMSVSCQAINKVMKSYLSNNQITPLLPILTIIANFIYEHPDHIIQQFITNSEFQSIIQQGLLSHHYQTERQAVFICNNLLYKSNNSRNFIIENSNLMKQIRKLNNDEVVVFCTTINSVSVCCQSQTNSMEEQIAQ